jgi:peptidoglycan/LPS O-acetylase OafA/YrhL
MRLHYMHERYLTSHADELPRLETGRPTLLAGCLAALAILIIALAVLAVIGWIAYAGDEAGWPVIVVALLALVAMARGQRR